MPLFEVAILEQPTKKSQETGIGEKLIMSPKCVLAKDSQSAAIKATQGEDLSKVDFDRMLVLVRPFA